MPTRHISPQSFDEILSDLGADPAIPDPHGIRKNPSHQVPPPDPINHPKQARWSSVDFPIQSPKTTQLLFLAITIGGLVAAFFFTFEAMKASSKGDIEGLEAQVVALKKELVLLREDWEINQEDIYQEMDLLEVSIHSNNIKPQNIAAPLKPTIPPEELELRRWRYLGSSQQGNSEQAFFQTGKGVVMLQKEGRALGDWSISDIQKDLVTLSNEKGKSIVLKSSRNQ